MKNIRHMTLVEYTEMVVPKIVELKKILRKKYLKSAQYSGLRHLPMDEYSDFQVNRYKNQKYFDETYARQQASKDWFHFKLKADPIPVEMYKRYNELFDELSPLFIDHTKAELGKLHKEHKAEIRRAIDTDVYVKELTAGVITFEELTPICDSVGVKIPKRVLALKEKVDAGMYSRESVMSTNEFTKSIRNFLAPFMNDLVETKRDQLMGWVDEFESQSKPFYNYWVTAKKRNDVYSELGMMYNHKENKRSDDFNKRIQNACDYYAESYVQTFIARINDKLSHVNLNWGIPTIEFTTNERLSGGQLNVDFKLTYSNGEVIQGDSKVIIAGGYIQCLHQRYLFHFWYGGKNVSLEQMDQLK